MKSKTQSILFFVIANIFWFGVSLFLFKKNSIAILVCILIALIFSILSIVMYVKDKREKGTDLKIPFLIIRYICTFILFLCSAYGVLGVIASFAPEVVSKMKQTDDDFGWYGWNYIGFICLAVIPLALFIGSIIKLFRTKKSLSESKK